MLVVGALLALAVPAMASAAPAKWKVGGVEVTAPTPIKASGSLTFEAQGSTIKCNVSAEGTINNVGGVGVNSITKFLIDASSCVVGGNLAGCTVEFAATNAPPETWPSEASQEGGKFFDTVSNIQFVDVFNAACPVAEIGAGGTVKAEYNNTTHALVFNKTPGLFIPTEPPTAATLTGTVTVTSPANVTLF